MFSIHNYALLTMSIYHSLVYILIYLLFFFIFLIKLPKSHNPHISKVNINQSSNINAKVNVSKVQRLMINQSSKVNTIRGHRFPKFKG